LYLRRIALLARPVSLLAMLLAAGCSEAAIGKGDGRTPEPGVVVDNGDRGFELTGAWNLAETEDAFDGDCAWAAFWDNPADGSIDLERYATATARPELPEPGMYEVFAWSCSAPASDISSQQRVWLCASRGYSCTPLYLDPSEDTGRWISLGTHFLDVDADVTVRNGATALGAPPGFETIADGAVVIDAFRFFYREPGAATLTPPPFAPRPTATEGG
jgi:hypothetical protein